jgi:hypothetical protein
MYLKQIPSELRAALNQRVYKRRLKKKGFVGIEYGTDPS